MNVIYGRHARWVQVYVFRSDLWFSRWAHRWALNKIGDTVANWLVYLVSYPRKGLCYKVHFLHSINRLEAALCQPWGDSGPSQTPKQSCRTRRLCRIHHTVQRGAVESKPQAIKLTKFDKAQQDGVWGYSELTMRGVYIYLASLSSKCVRKEHNFTIWDGKLPFTSCKELWFWLFNILLKHRRRHGLREGLTVWTLLWTKDLGYPFSSAFTALTSLLAIAQTFGQVSIWTDTACILFGNGIPWEGGAVWAIIPNFKEWVESKEQWRKGWKITSANIMISL